MLCWAACLTEYCVDRQVRQYVVSGGYLSRMLDSMLCSMLRWAAFWIVPDMLSSMLCLAAYCAAYRVWLRIVQHIVFGSVL